MVGSTNTINLKREKSLFFSLLVYICAANINLTHIVAVYSKDTPWIYDAPTMKD